MKALAVALVLESPHRNRIGQVRAPRRQTRILHQSLQALFRGRVAPLVEFEEFQSLLQVQRLDLRELLLSGFEGCKEGCKAVRLKGCEAGRPS